MLVPSGRGCSDYLLNVVLLRALLLCAFAPACFAAPGQLTVAAAADLQPVMQVIAAKFQQQTGTAVRVTFGSSGNLFSQIRNGAPYDLFFSADVSYPEKLQAGGLAEPGSLSLFATGKIVLLVHNNASVDISRGLSVLTNDSFKKIAIANPAHAPYGRAAEAALKNAGVWEKVSSKLVMGENISQASQFVESGNADAGILALSLVVAPGMEGLGRYFEIPQDLYPPLQQASVILKSSTHKQDAKAFLLFLQRPEIVGLLKTFGFVPVEAQPR